MTGRLAGKVAIITGASTGLGPVLGSVFAREGARVLLAARREELVREAAAAAGNGAIAIRADVTNEDDVEVTFANSAQRTLHLWNGRAIGPHRIDDDARPSLVTLQQPS